MKVEDFSFPPLNGERFDAALEAMSDRFHERTGSYKDGYLRVARILRVLFPDGVPMSTEAEAVRFFFVFMNIVKLVRITDNIDTGHEDSSHDMAVYATMFDAIEKGSK